MGGNSDRTWIAWVTMPIWLPFALVYLAYDKARLWWRNRKRG